MRDSKINRIKELVAYLDKCRNAYYNSSSPLISDAQYDKLFDELSALEKETGIILASSPTRVVGYEVKGELEKVAHKIPLLSLAKTKDVNDVLEMSQKAKGYLALKMDGLTVKLTYKDGVLVEAATRGDGNEGELITHNARCFTNIPTEISIKEELVITGEAFIDIDTFDKINECIENDENKYSTPRNLAAGSVRQLDSKICKERGVKFYPFQVLNGFDDINSRIERLDKLTALGFERIPAKVVEQTDTAVDISNNIAQLKDVAEKNYLPIDGIVFSYDNVAYAASLGRTSHHFRDGIAYKFSDPMFNTVLNDIEWNISRTGQLTPIALFKAVEIDNTIVERASLHNITFIEDLMLLPGDEITVSKRNMIIPHVERNVTGAQRKSYSVQYPSHCPVCKAETQVTATENSDRTIKVLYCNNPVCPGKKIKTFTHFVSKNALNIDGLSEQTLQKFINKGFLKNLSDIFLLKNYENEITVMDGFGQKSFNNLIQSIEAASKTTLSRFIVSLNIGLIGKANAAAIEEYFNGDVKEFTNAACGEFDFSTLEGVGEIMNGEIHNWFKNSENLNEYNSLIDIIEFDKFEKQEISTDNVFYGKTIVITGKFKDKSRDELTAIFKALGAKVTSAVSAKTDLLICGDDAGSKLAKAKSLGIKIITEAELTL